MSSELNTATCDTQYDTNKECIAPNTCTFMTRYLKSMLGMGQEKILPPVMHVVVIHKEQEVNTPMQN